jgi:ribosomal protein S18 acetylase RimI-like enzyme
LKEPETFCNKNIIFRNFLKSDTIDLAGAGLNLARAPLHERIFQAIGFEPRKMGFVAYHTREKQAVGFLLLTEHTTWLYSVKSIFTDPNLRKMGVATGLLNFALSQAKSRRARKVFLNVTASEDFLINQYTKMGFRVIAKSLEVWAHAHVLEIPIQHENKLTVLSLDSRKNKNLLLGICQRCMGKEWMDFFEINNDNLINGFSQDFRRFFFRSGFINNSADSFAIVFSRPLSHIAFVEMFTTMDSAIPSLLEGLINILRSGGKVYARIKLFNVNDNVTVDLLKENQQYLDHTLCMGSYL